MQLKRQIPKPMMFAVAEAMVTEALCSIMHAQIVHFG